MNETFLSYSRRDSEFARRLQAALAESGIDIWCDWEDIQPAVLWRQEILMGVQLCHNFLFIISPDSIESKECQIELTQALLLNKRLIPIVCRRVDPNEIHPALSELNWIFFDENFDTGLALLLSVLDSPLGTSIGERLDSSISVVTVGQALRTFFLYRDRYVIGRYPAEDVKRAGLIYINDNLVSRTHLSLIRREGDWAIADGAVELSETGKIISSKPSRYGVSINNQPLEKVQLRPLRHSDEIKISPRTFLRYEEVLPNQENFEPDYRDTEINSFL